MMSIHKTSILSVFCSKAAISEGQLVSLLKSKLNRLLFTYKTILAFKDPPTNSQTISDVTNLANQLLTVHSLINDISQTIQAAMNTIHVFFRIKIFFYRSLVH